MSKESIKDYLEGQDIKPKKQPVTVYMTAEELTKLDGVVSEFNSSRTAVVSALINLHTQGE